MAASKKPRMVRHAELVAVDEARAAVQAERDRCLSVLADLIRTCIPELGYTTHEQQQAIREARACLAEVKR